ncbi:MAG: cytochrome-c peroxidase [Gammaproteobacteria bacterium]
MLGLISLLPPVGLTQETTSGPLLPIPTTVNVDKETVQLGYVLFHDRRLSKDNSTSCASCHNLATAGTNHTPVSFGVNKSPGLRNAPSVYNARYNYFLLWDAQNISLEEQIDGPVHNERELANDWPTIIKRLNTDKYYQEQFKNLYPDGITEANIKHAIGSFQRALNTPNARFDQFLRGDKSALSPEEYAGYQLFINYGCVACHQGRNIGGNMYQKFGVFGDYYQDTHKPNNKDFGRYNLTKQEADRYVFRVPSLRNVELTFPYFHDGSVETLEEAVYIMGKYQLGRELTKEEIQQLITFLKTLTGEFEFEHLVSQQSPHKIIRTYKK